jgi:predicted DNA-binding transcriptional regulator AlpA
MSQFPPRAFIRMAAELERAEPQATESIEKQMPPSDDLRFLSLQDVLDRLTISRSLLYELMKDPIEPFPEPVHIRRRSVWAASEVETYMKSILEKARRRNRTVVPPE